MIFVFLLFLGVSKPGHRCARIDDLASDVYSAIEYIHANKGSPRACKFISEQLIRACVPALNHKEESSKGIEQAHWRVVPLQRRTRSHTNAESWTHARAISCTRALSHPTRNARIKRDLNFKKSY